MAGERLYSVIYIDPEDGETYEAVYPEDALPDIEEILDIEVCGRLAEGYKIVVDEDPDPGEKELIPINRRKTA